MPFELTLEMGEQNNSRVTGRLMSAERRVSGCNKDCQIKAAVSYLNLSGTCLPGGAWAQRHWGRRSVGEQC